MLSMSPITHSLQFANTYPNVKVLDVTSDVSDLTTYTFTSCNLGDLGSVASIADTYGTNPKIRSSGRKFIVVIVHGEDALASFSVNSVTIGGVSGSERVDRGGVTNAVNTAIYTWTTDSLQGITNTDIAVTFSEAVTSCAVGVLLVESVGLFALVGSNSTTGTGESGAGVIPAIELADNGLLYIMGSTHVTGGLTQTFQLLNATVTNPLQPPRLLYESSNAEMDFAAAWSFSQHYSPANSHTIRFDWSGTAAHDVAGAIFY